MVQNPVSHVVVFGMALVNRESKRNIVDGSKFGKSSQMETSVAKA